VLHPSKKSLGVSAGGQKGRGGPRKGIFARLLWREATRPCESKEAKPAKIDSLIEKDFCSRPLKDLSIFAGFVRRQAASRWAGCRAAGAASEVSVRIFSEKGSDFVQYAEPT